MTIDRTSTSALEIDNCSLLDMHEVIVPALQSGLEWCLGLAF